MRQERAVVVFQAAQNLFNDNMSKVVMNENEEEQLQISKGRALNSYCFEFCGKVDIPFNRLRFYQNEKEVNLN